MDHRMHSDSRNLWKAVVLLALAVFSCHDPYDPYKNPRPPSKPKEHRERQPKFNFPVLPSCTPLDSPFAPGSPSPPKPGWGCTSRPDTNTYQPRHRRDPQPVKKEEENGPVFPCPNHIFPFCTDENPFGVTYKSGTTGYAAFPRRDTLGCLMFAPCPTWFYMQIDQPGDLLIYIEQKGFLKKLDVDFACWGPFEAVSKRDFLDRLCSGRYALDIEGHPNHRPAGGDHRSDTGGYPFGNLVDCSFDPAGTEWCYIPNANKGEWYLLLLTNYSRKKGTVHFDRVHEMSTATTNCQVVVPITLNPVPQGLRHIDDHTSAICLYDDKALITIDLETDEGYKLPRRSLHRCLVEVRANGKRYPAKLVKGHFECEIDILEDRTEYSAFISCDDPEFDLDTETYAIVRSTDCDPDQVEFTIGDPFYAGGLTTIELAQGDNSVDVDFSRPGGITTVLPGNPDINIQDYDIQVDYDPFYIERVDTVWKEDILKLTPKSIDGRCDCFLPDTVSFRVRMIPANGDIHATPYEIPVQLGVLHQTVWIGRCLWALITIGALLLLILYLILLRRKRRFKKDAMVIPTYFDYRGNRIEQGGYPLRKEGFPAWFSRWFLPWDERNTLSWTVPQASLRFVAADSEDMVRLPKEGNIDPDTVNISGYNPYKDPQPEEPVKLGDNSRINIRKPDGTPAGFLTFSAGSSRDGVGYRIFLFILILSAIILVLILMVMIIRGLR